jgi:hypothetical protein
MIELRDIIISARQESTGMGHHYLGVEHLFIAMLKIRGGLTGALIESQGFTPEYVLELILRKTFRGGSQRLWAGMPYTPRTDVVLDIANDLGLEHGSQVTERELLRAILIENDNLPTRALGGLGLSTAHLASLAETFVPMTEPEPPDLHIYFQDERILAEQLLPNHLLVLRRMFREYASIRVEQRLTGFSGALVLVVTPIQSNGQEDSPVVAKIHEIDSIQDEFQRYETHIKNTMPLQTARVEDKPTIPDNSELGGLKYTLVSSSGTVPSDLRHRVQQQGISQLDHLLQDELYAQFRKTWWQLRRPYRFQVWKEYEWLLPPALTLDYIPPETKLDSPLTLRTPLNRTRIGEKLRGLVFGDGVVLENFTVRKIEQRNNTLKLAIGFGSEAEKHAFKIELRGLGNNPLPLFRGEILEQIQGKVIKTRYNALTDSVRVLNPDFDLSTQEIKIGDLHVPNPLQHYDSILERNINGSISRIHGDLHLGNIIAGPRDTVWLIDFGHTREGHTIFDWATLEISVLGDALMPFVDEGWESVRTIALEWLEIQQGESAKDEGHTGKVLQIIHALREIVRECLANTDDWSEYYSSIAFCSLRALAWPTMSLGSRRLLFLISGLALAELNKRTRGLLETPSPDRTELTNLPRPLIPPQK